MLSFSKWYRITAIYVDFVFYQQKVSGVHILAQQHNICSKNCPKSCTVNMKNISKFGTHQKQENQQFFFFISKKFCCKILGKITYVWCKC